MRKATGTMSDDELEDDDDGDEGSEWTWTHGRTNKLNHGNEEHMILASNINDLSPLFAHYGWQNGPISPQNGQNEQYPPKRGNKQGDKKFVLYIHI